jgi:hypothetical protein
MDVTQQVCPSSEYGETHHLVPRRDGTGQVLRCRYCGKSEKELRGDGERASKVVT